MEGAYHNTLRIGTDINRIVFAGPTGIDLCAALVNRWWYVAFKFLGQPPSIKILKQPAFPSVKLIVSFVRTSKC